MGKASRKKRREESQAKSIAMDKLLEAGKTFDKWGLFRSPFFHLILVVVIGLLAYSNTFNVPFVFDDVPNIVDNYKLRDLSNFWPPSESRWFGFLTFAINYHLGGLNVIGYHIINLIIHVINAILVYYIVSLTFKTPYFKVSVNSASVSNQPNQFNLSTFQPFNYLPLFTALLFVSHPIQTQAVTYIWQRITSLATFFYLLSLVMYIKFRLWVIGNRLEVKSLTHHPLPITYYLLSLLSAVLAMKTKEISFTLPFIIALYEFSFLGKSGNYELRAMSLKRFLYLLPFLSTLIIIPLSLIGPELGIYKPEIDAGEDLRQLQLKEAITLSKCEYLLTQFRVIVTYVRLLFFPINQNLDYDYPLYHSFFEPNVFLSFLFLLSIFSLGIYLWVKGFKVLASCESPGRQGFKGPTNQPSTFKPFNLKLISFGIFWFFVTLSVESSIIPIVDVIYEHRLYLPSIGMFIALNTVLFIFVEKLKHKWKEAERMVIGVLVVIVIVLTGVAYARNIVWKDEITLWKDVVNKSPEKARGHNNLGKYYYRDGQIDRAIEHYQIALKLKIDYTDAHYNLGLAYLEKGIIDKARKEFEIALQINPYDYQARQFLNYTSNLNKIQKP